MENRKMGASFWFVWIPLNLIVFGIIYIARLFIGFFSRANGQDFTIGEFLFLAFFSSLWGFGQWLVLRTYLKNVSTLWILATALGVPASMWALRLIPMNQYIHSSPVHLFFITSLIYGLAQWLALRRSLKEVGMLIFTNLISYTIAIWLIIEGFVLFFRLLVF